MFSTITFLNLEHIQPDLSNMSHTSGRAARSLTGHVFSTQMDASKWPQTPGLTGIPHMQSKYGPDMGVPGHACHVDLTAWPHVR